MQLATINQSQITNRVSAAGKALGTRVHFAGTVTAADVKKTLTTANPALKGAALRKAVNEALRGESDIRWMTFDALTSAARSSGFIPDYADTNAKGTGLVARMVKPIDPKGKAEKPAKDDQSAKIAELEAKLAAIEARAAEAGFTVEEIVERGLVGEE